jgi:hypothetical protein
MTQSTVEERLSEKFDKIFQALYEFPYIEFRKPPEGMSEKGIAYKGMYANQDVLTMILDFIKSEIKLAEQKAREEERERIVEVIKNFEYDDLDSSELTWVMKNDIINQITKE